MGGCDEVCTGNWAAGILGLVWSGLGHTQLSRELVKMSKVFTSGFLQVQEFFSAEVKDYVNPLRSLITSQDKRTIYNPYTCEVSEVIERIHFSAEAITTQI